VVAYRKFAYYRHLHHICASCRVSLVVARTTDSSNPLLAANEDMYTILDIVDYPEPLKPFADGFVEGAGGSPSHDFPNSKTRCGWWDRIQKNQNTETTNL
jgi:hypothetical protein